MLKRQLSHFNKSLWSRSSFTTEGQSVRSIGIEPFPGAPGQILLKFLIIPNLSTRAPRQLFTSSHLVAQKEENGEEMVVNFTYEESLRDTAAMELKY